jgi:RNA polymerase sigma-70 factor (ECF subfamily)
MTIANLSAFLRRLTRGKAAETRDGPADGQLVEDFLARREPAAFEAILRRHGPMVYRVCWRVLQQEQDVEDAFQATFLVLAQKLHGLRRHESLASWLHGVAHRVALKARARDATRRQREQLRLTPEAVDADEVTWGELRALLDAELAQLPEKWRRPLILCYLEGRTQDEAAGDLGWSKNTLRRRLEEAREALTQRLRRGGVVWPAAISGVLLSDCLAAAALPPALVGSTVAAASQVVAGQPIEAILPARVIALFEGAVPMFVSRFKVALAALLLVSVAGISWGAWVLYAGPPVDPVFLPVQEPVEAKNPARREGDIAKPVIAPDKSEDQKPSPEEDLIAQELKKLSGKWQLLALMVNGENLLAKEEPRERPMVIKDGKLSNEGEGKNRLEAVLKLSPNRELRQIDFIFTTGEVRGKITSGIYKLEGDFLTICTSDANRPNEFTSKPGSGNHLLIYKRQQP